MSKCKKRNRQDKVSYSVTFL